MTKSQSNQKDLQSLNKLISFRKICWNTVLGKRKKNISGKKCILARQLKSKNANILDEERQVLINIGRLFKLKMSKLLEA